MSPIRIPIFKSIEEEAEVYRNCGRLATAWGPLELSLEAMLITLRFRQNHPGDGFAYGDFPVSFSRKVSEMKDRIKSDPIWHPLNDSLRPLISEANEIHKIRTWVCHSICQGTDLSGKIIFGKCDQKNGFAYIDIRIHVDEIRAAAARLPVLTSNIESLWLPYHRNHSQQLPQK